MRNLGHRDMSTTEQLDGDRVEKGEEKQKSSHDWFLQVDARFNGHSNVKILCFVFNKLEIKPGHVSEEVWKHFKIMKDLSSWDSVGTKLSFKDNLSAYAAQSLANDSKFPNLPISIIVTSILNIQRNTKKKLAYHIERNFETNVNLSSLA